MKRFKVGDIAVGIGFVKSLDFNGAECEITGSIDTRECIGAISGELETWLAYEVRWAGGEIGIVREPNLRRQRPKDALGSWEELADIWQPQELVV